MGSAVQVAQGPEVQRFEMDGTDREGVVMSFANDSYVQVTPDLEGPGCDISWTTTMGGPNALRQAMYFTGRDVLYGSLALTPNDPRSEDVHKNGEEVVKALMATKYGDLQEAWLFAPPVRAHWRKDVLPQRGTSGFYNLMHLWIGEPFTRQPDDPSETGEQKITKALNTREVVLACIAKTATALVRDNREKVIDSAALNIPLLRAA